MNSDDLIRRKDALDALTLTIKTNDAPYVGQYARRAIKNIPAVDAAPVVHGRWIYKERHRKNCRQYTGYDSAGEMHTIMAVEESEGKEPYCSECGAQAAESFIDFCPHCGAKMDADEAREEIENYLQGGDGE